MSQIKAVIFDLDGVLVHTDRMHFTAWQDLAKRLNIPFDEEIYSRMRGVSRMESLDILLEQGKDSYTQAQKEAMAAEKNAAYRSLITTMRPQDVAPDVRDTLTALSQRGVLLAVGSSSKNAPEILRRTELARYFQAVADGNSVARAKPYPDVFLKAAELLGVAPAEALIVEDAIAGIEAAVAGGFVSVAFGSDAAQSPLAQYRLQRLSALLKLI